MTTCESSILKLPDQLVLDILLRLPTKSVVRCRSVLKSWRNIINEEYFRNLHCERMPYDPNPTLLFHTSKETGRYNQDLIISMCFAQNHHHPASREPEPRFRHIFKAPSVQHYQFSRSYYGLLNTCNGLVCMRSSHHSGESRESNIDVCNPITLEYITIPPCTDSARIDDSRSALGFNPSTKEYKLVSIISNSDSCSSKVFAYTLGRSGEWRKVQDLMPRIYPVTSPLYLDGRIYWMEEEKSARSRLNFCLIWFDMECENVGKLRDLPIRFQDKVPFSVELAEVRGCLSLIHAERRSIDVWLLKDPRGKYSWQLLRRFAFTKDRHFSGLSINGVWDQEGIVKLWVGNVMKQYDRKNHRNCKEYKVPNLWYKWTLCTTYRPSFISLKTFGDCKNMETSLDSVKNMEPPPNIMPPP